MKTDMDALLAVRERYKAAVEAEQELRENARADILFEDGDQWDEADKTARAQDGRPCLVINKISGVVKQVVGDGRKNRPRIKARGVDNQGDPQTAQVITGLIKNIENQSDAESAYDWGLECATRSGFGYWRVTTDYAGEDVFDQDILIERVTNQFSIYLDPEHRAPTGKDAGWAFELYRMTKEAFEEEYPDKEASSWDVSGIGMDTETGTKHVWCARYWYKEPSTKELFLLTDGRVVEIVKPKVEKLYDEQGQEIQAVTGKDQYQPLPFVRRRTSECYKVKWQKWSGTELLEEGDWAGKYIPIVQVVGEESWVDGEKRLRSVFYHAKDAQRLYNWSRSLAAETLSMAPRQPFLLTPEEIEGHEAQWGIAHRKPMPYLLHNESQMGRPQRQPPSVPDVGAYQESQMSADDIKATTGVFDASLGQRSNETSGVAIRARQSEGDNATFVFHDNLTKSIRFTGEIILDLLPKIYDTERVVRLMNEDGSEAWQKINTVDPITGERINDLSTGKYDVYMDAGPNYATQRAETADGMLRFMQAFPPSAPVVAPLLAQVMEWPQAQEVSQKLQALTAPPEQGPSPEEQMDLQKTQLDIEGKALSNEQKKVSLAQDMGEADQRMAEIAQAVAAQTVMAALQQLGVVR